MVGRRNAGGFGVGGGLAWRGATLVLVVFALLVPAAAGAAVPTAGSWTGSGLTFTVGTGGTVLSDFVMPTMPVFCTNPAGPPGSGQAETRTFGVPPGPISASGDFDIVDNRTITFNDGTSRGDGFLELKGSFTSATTVSGTADWHGTGYCYGAVDFTGTLQTAAPGAGPGPGPSPGPSPGPAAPGQVTPPSPTTTTDAGPTLSGTHKKHKKHKKHTRRRRRHR